MWKLKTGERIARWRDFRKNLDSLPLDQAMMATADFWQSCPFAPYYLDSTDPEEWPNPWELIEENYYCDLAKCLGIVYTIALTQHGQDLDAELRIYYDPESKVTYNLAVFDQGKYVINLTDGEVVNIESIKKTLQLRHKYKKADLKIQ